MLLVTLGGISVLSGCSGPTPLCDQASILVGKGQLAQGMALYGRAKEQGEGACADDGLTAAADQYGKAATEEARGAAAEQAGDISGAITAYRSALTQDIGNPLAAAGLARLGQGTIRTPQIATGPPLPAPTPRTPWWATPWPYVIGSILLAILSLGMSIGYTRRSSEQGQARCNAFGTGIKEQLDQQCKELGSELRAQRQRIGELDEQHKALECQLRCQEERIDELDEQHKALGGELQSQQDRHERLLDQLVNLIADKKTDLESDVAEERERYFKQPAPENQHHSAAANDGVCLSDVRIFAVATSAGQQTLVAERIRWSTDRGHANATLSEISRAGEVDPVMLAHAFADKAVSPAWEGVREVWTMPDCGGATTIAGTTKELQRQYYDLVHGLSVRVSEPTRGLVPATTKGPNELAAGLTARDHNGCKNIKLLVRFTGLVDSAADNPTVTDACLTTLVGDLSSELAARHLKNAADVTTTPRRTITFKSVTGSALAQATELARRLAAARNPNQPAGASAATDTPEALAEGRAPVTVYVLAEPHAPLSVRHKGHSASGATFVANDRVVIGDHNKVRLSSEYRIDNIEVDAERMMEILSPRAQQALRKLIENPADAGANRRFRDELRPPEEPPFPSTADLQHQSVVSTPVTIRTTDCDVVAIGDKQRHNVTVKHRVARASLDIAGMMKDSPTLASAFARQLSPIERGHGRRELDRVLTKAVTSEHLSSIVSTVPGRSPRIVTGPGSVAVEHAPISIVGEKPTIVYRVPEVTVKRVVMPRIPAISEPILPTISRVDQAPRAPRSPGRIPGPGRGMW